VLLVISVWLMFIIAAYSARQLPERFGALVRWGSLVTMVWMSVKAALMRQDPVHETRAVVSIGVFFALYVVVYRRRWSAYIKAFSVAAGLGLLSLFISGWHRPINVGRSIGQLASLIRSGTAPAEAKNAEAIRKVRSEVQQPWPSVSSVAAFGSYQSLLLGHPGHRIQLPVVASYEIWSPWTSRRVREFFMGPKAPDYLVYTASPSSAELASILTARYQEITRAERYRLFRRRPVALPVAKRLVLEREIKASELIELSPKWREAPVIAEIRYTKTFLSTLISAFYQPPEAFVVLLHGNSRFATVRMNALLSEEGIVLSSAPGVWDGRPKALHGIRFGLLTDERTQATAIRFEASGAVGRRWDRYFAPKLRVRLYIPEFVTEAQRSP
jgi:hypothetical protein